MLNEIQHNLCFLGQSMNKTSNVYWNPALIPAYAGENPRVTNGILSLFFLLFFKFRARIEAGFQLTFEEFYQPLFLLLCWKFSPGTNDHKNGYCCIA